MKDKILILKNTPSEGPGTIEEFLVESSIPYRVCELSGAEAPPGLEGFSALVMLGGPMAVYEMDKYPHLVAGSRLIREAINREMKVLGICLGAQMIAHCLGAEVYKGEEEELGWHHVELMGEAVKDPLMRRLALHPEVGDFWKRFRVFQWHGDTFGLPPDAVRLAGSELYQNQAFRYESGVYAFQFHIEVTLDMLVEWFSDRPEGPRILNESEVFHEELSGRAMNFYREFFKPSEKGK